MWTAKECVSIMKTECLPNENGYRISFSIYTLCGRKSEGWARQSSVIYLIVAKNFSITYMEWINRQCRAISFNLQMIFTPLGSFIYYLGFVSGSSISVRNEFETKWIGCYWYSWHTYMYIFELISSWKWARINCQVRMTELQPTCGVRHSAQSQNVNRLPIQNIHNKTNPNWIFLVEYVEMGKWWICTACWGVCIGIYNTHAHIHVTHSHVRIYIWLCVRVHGCMCICTCVWECRLSSRPAPLQKGRPTPPRNRLYNSGAARQTHSISLRRDGRDLTTWSRIRSSTCQHGVFVTSKHRVDHFASFWSFYHEGKIFELYLVENYNT